MKGLRCTGLLATIVLSTMMSGCDEAGEVGSSAKSDGNEALVMQPAAGQSDVSLVSAVKVALPAGAYLLNDAQSAITVYQDGNAVEGQVIQSNYDNTVTFQPKAQLDANAQYQVVLEGWVSSAGELKESSTWQFTTVGELGATPQWVIDTCMTQEDKALLAELNEIRLQGGICGDKSFSPVQALSWHCDLVYVASEHAADQARMGLIGTTGSNGMGPVGRMATTSVIWRGIAENDLVVVNGQSAVAASLDTPAHCENVHSPALSHVGMASAPTADGLEQSVWTQLFVQM